MCTTVPFGEKENRISSMRLFRMNTPRPLSFIRFSGSSGSRQGIRVESAALVFDIDPQINAVQPETDPDDLVRIQPVSVEYGVPDRLGDGYGQVVQFVRGNAVGFGDFLRQLFHAAQLLEPARNFDAHPLFARNSSIFA